MCGEKNEKISHSFLTFLPIQRHPSVYIKKKKTKSTIFARKKKLMNRKGGFGQKARNGIRQIGECDF